MDVTPGTLVGAYRLDRLLGKGSMGAVWVGEDVHLRRRVAVKVLAPELADDDRFRRRFLLESQLAASLEHPHIVPIYAAGEQDGSLFLAMRLIEGVDLRALLRERHHLDPRRALALLGQAAEGLDAAHAIGLVHRDVKPANVLVAAGPPEHAYLCDFGLAKHASSVDSLTGERSFVGTISYIAPEQIEGGPVDARADQYALACVLYECLTGVKPYEREGELQTLFAHLREDAPRVTDVEPALGSAIDEVLARALDKDPDARYATCVEMIRVAAGALGVDAPSGPSTTTAPPQIVPRTFVIADVRGYTAFTSEHGDEAAGRLAAGFERVMREVATAHDGRVLEIRGDEALAVFDSARNALRAALAAQARFADDPPARGVGIGIDTGEAAPTGEGFRGSALNTAARLCSLAGPGDVLASETTTRIAGATDGIAYAEPREQRVKGIPEPVGFVPVVPPGSEGAAARPSSAPRRRDARRRSWVLAAVVGLLVIAAGAVAWLATGGAGDEAVPYDSLAILNAQSGEVSGSMPTGSSDMGALVADGSGFWGLAGTQTVFLQRIDTRKREVTRQVPLEHEPYWVAPRVAFGAVWLTWTASDRPQLVRFDARYGLVTKRVTLPLPKGAYGTQAEGVAVTADAVWVAYGYPKRVARVDPQTGKVTRVVDLPDAAEWQETLLAAGDGQLWAIDRTGRRIVRLDPSSGAVVGQGRIKETQVEDAAVAGGNLWLAGQNDGGVWQIDRNAAVVGRIPTGDDPWALAVGEVGGVPALFVSNKGSGTVTRVDPTGAAEPETFGTGHLPLAIGVLAAQVWVFLGQSVDDAVAAIPGDRVVNAAFGGDPFSLDPSWFWSTEAMMLHYGTGVRLMDVRYGTARRPRLVPTGSAREPSVSADRRTWTFEVRKGLRFSPPSNAPVTAQTWKASLERALSPVFGCSQLLPEIVGLAAYRAGKAPHVAGIRANGSTLAIRLVEPSSTLATRLANICFTLVPEGTPAVEGGIAEPIPSAGPYYVARSVPGQALVLQRNPGYGGDLPQHLDGLVLRLSSDVGKAAASVVADETDYLGLANATDVPSMAPGGSLERRFGSGPDQRYYRPESTSLITMLLDSREGPLRDASVRKAVSLAVDRRALAAVDGGFPAPLAITPGLPAHQEASSARQLAQARELLAGRRPHLVLVTFEAAGGKNRERTRILSESLAEVGIDLEVRIVVDPFAVITEKTFPVDMLLSGWIPDWVDPQAVISPLLDPASPESFGFFTDPRWVGRIRAAAETMGPKRIATYRKLDRDLRDGPVPFVPLTVNTGAAQILSTRTGCRSFLPQYGGMLDLTQLCLDGKS